MLGQITISNRSKKRAQIDIEGIIGVPEEWQFEDCGNLIATYRKLKEAVNDISAIEAKSVIVNIRSTGGNVNDALLIYDTLVALDCEITTRCYGYVASAATIIAQAASKGCREISQNALYLVHRSSSTTEGNSQQLSQAIEMLNKTDERIAAIYANKSGRESSSFMELMGENGGNGRWMAPQEVVDAGLADRIISPSRISNSAKAMVEQLNLPEIPGEYLEKGGGKLFKKLKSMLDITATEHEPPANRGDEKPAHCEVPGSTLTVAQLQNKIVELEAANAKLRAKATQTFPKEDPSTKERRVEKNADAYEKDIMNIKSY